MKEATFSEGNGGPLLTAALGDGPVPTEGRLSLSLRQAIRLGIERSTDVQIVAEGVEDEAQQEFLTS